MPVATPGSKLRINNTLFRIPPSNISVVKNSYNQTISGLRTSTGTHYKSGRKNIAIIVDLMFATGYNASRKSLENMNSWVNNELAPLLVQVRKCPFVSIENEKIRKEVLGEDLSLGSGLSPSEINYINMAAVIQSITASVSAREAEVVNVRLVMQYFNYTPFTPDFTYLGFTPSGKPIPLDVPGDSFDLFYKNDTHDGQTFLNEISTEDGLNLELYYKEYLDVPRGEQDPFFKRGWTVEKDFERNSTSKTLLMSRWKRFKIQNNTEIHSGDLIVESGSMVLSTKVPLIPLNGHVLPTAQFLGCSNGEITLNLFANAELKKKTNTPIGSSRQLATLSRMMEVISHSTVRHHRYTKDEVILIKHPLSKLLKYERTDDTATVAIDEVTGRLVNFDPNDCLGCTIDNFVTQNVEGLPYCSRATLVLTENWKPVEPNIQEETSTGSGLFKEATIGMIRTLASRYSIKKDPVIGFYLSGAPLDLGISARELDKPAALKLIKFLNDSRVIKDLEDVDSYLSDASFLEKKSSEYTIKELKISATDPTLDVLGAVTPEDLGLSGGISLPQNREPLSSDRINELGTDILTSTVSPESGDSLYPEYKPFIIQFQSFNRVKDTSTYPDMRLPKKDDGTFYQPDFFFYNIADTSTVRTFKKRIKRTLQDRFVEGAKKYDEQVGNEDGSKSFDDEVRPSLGPPTSAPNIVASDPENARDKKEKNKTDKQFSQNPLNEGDQLALLSRATDLFDDTTYSMRRAMPTFKLYIHEEEGISSLIDQKKERVIRRNEIWRSFSDFYDLSSLIEIRLVKDEENPADLLVIRIANTGDDIATRDYLGTGNPLKGTEKKSQKIKKDSKTVEEKELEAVILREGRRVQLRMGYDVNPNNLSVEFNGRITRVTGEDILEIVCQGNGLELVQELKGVGVQDEFTWNSSTTHLIAKLLSLSSEVASFGTRGAKTDLGDYDLFWRASGGRTTVENIFAPSLWGTWNKFGERTIRYAGIGAVIGTPFFGLGAFPAAAIGGAIGLAADTYDAVSTFFRGSKFVIYEQTIWDVLQELTLRHPGTVCDVVPFDNRSTIFFGYPDQFYFSRGPTYPEMIQTKLASTAFGLVEPNRREALKGILGVSNLHLRRGIEVGGTKVVDKEGEETPLAKNDSSVSILEKSLKPYRSYHLITSLHDIVENNMVVNADGVYNSTQIVYPDSIDSDDLNFDGSSGFSEYKKTDEIKADDDLNRDYIKRQTLVFHNAHKDVVDHLPEQYAVSSLCRSLKNVYKGKIKILGRPGIKPHDIVFIFDIYNQITGMVLVRNVVQTISYETGWVTEITPGMIVMPSATGALKQQRAMQKLAKTIALRNCSIFYQGAVIEKTQNLLTSEDKLSSLAGEALRGAKTGLAYGSAGLIGANNISRLTEELAIKTAAKGTAKTAVKAGIGKKILSTTGGVFKFAKRGLGFIAGPAAVIGADMLIDYAVDAYVSWSKFRQPIVFSPVYRNGKAWYAGLYGLKKNSEMDAIEGSLKETLNKAEGLYDYVKDEFSAFF